MTGGSFADERSVSYAGWRVVAALFLVQLAIFGFGLYGQGIYVSELRRLNDWPTALISTGTTLCLILGSLLSMFVSDILERWDPRALVLAGVAALFVGLILLATASSPIQLYAGFFILSLAWVGLGTITAASIVGLWFDCKRGLAISLTFTGATCSGIVLAPGLVLLVERLGFRSALILAACTALVILVPVVAFFIRSPVSRSETSDRTLAAPPLRRAALLREPGFWSVTAPFALALLVQVGFIVHQISILTPKLGFQAAGGAVSLTTAMALVGRLGLGLFVDRVNPRAVAAISMLSQALALLVIGLSDNTAGLFLACAVFGLSIGNLITLPALIVQHEFASESFGVVLGFSMAISGVVNACGPALMGGLRDITDGYTTPILVGAVLHAAAALSVVIRPNSLLPRPA